VGRVLLYLSIVPASPGCGYRHRDLGRWLRGARRCVRGTIRWRAKTACCPERATWVAGTYHDGNATDATDQAVAPRCGRTHRTILAAAHPGTVATSIRCSNVPGTNAKPELEWAVTRSAARATTVGAAPTCSTRITTGGSDGTAALVLWLAVATWQWPADPASNYVDNGSSDTACAVASSTLDPVTSFDVLDSQQCIQAGLDQLSAAASEAGLSLSLPSAATLASMPLPQQLMTLVNDVRAAYGLGPLQYDPAMLSTTELGAEQGMDPPEPNLSGMTYTSLGCGT